MIVSLSSHTTKVILSNKHVLTVRVKFEKKELKLNPLLMLLKSIISIIIEKSCSFCGILLRNY